ncbi:MAG: hypothetical protein AAF927_10315 [Bacteroidota bacterium]
MITAKKKYVLFTAYLSLLIGACMVSPDMPPNPFEMSKSIQIPIADSGLVNSLPASHIVSLHQRVFSPTCANSGCHDGSFEPDFRTVESTYNTLVYQEVIKNNPQGSFQYRVDPFHPERSVLWERLTHDIDGQSGLMPLVVESGSEWEQNKDSLLQAIHDWIASGAPDMFGNTPITEALPPSVRGAIGIIASERDPIRREGGNGKMLISPGTQRLELYLSLQADISPANQISSVKLRLSKDRNDFHSASGDAVQVIPSPIVSYGFTGELEEFYHHITIPLDTLVLGDYQYFRVYIQVEGQNELIEIPGDGSADYMKEMFAFEIYD